MFNSVRGIITEKRKESICVLCGGLEWEISVPATDIAELPPTGEEGRVFTWLYHREDQMKLYGFSGEERRATFLELIKVEGVGPKGALKIMGGIGQEELEKALEAEDLSRLEAVPGLGKKTAQKMILALKGKLARPAPQARYGELVEALAEMGYDRKAASDALAKAEAEISREFPAHASAQEKEKLLFRQAIVNLSRGVGE
jgi:Holliday junction DNA helicase RuvA